MNSGGKKKNKSLRKKLPYFYTACKLRIEN